MSSFAPVSFSPSVQVRVGHRDKKLTNIIVETDEHAAEFCQTKQHGQLARLETEGCDSAQMFLTFVPFHDNPDARPDTFVDEL